MTAQGRGSIKTRGRGSRSREGSIRRGGGGTRYPKNQDKEGGGERQVNFGLK